LKQIGSLPALLENDSQTSIIIQLHTTTLQKAVPNQTIEFTSLFQAQFHTSKVLCDSPIIAILAYDLTLARSYHSYTKSNNFWATVMDFPKAYAYNSSSL